MKNGCLTILVLLALADAFIVDSVANGSSPFKVAWITSGE
jgi:hypothetical protein